VEYIYTVDPKTRKLSKARALSFAEAGIKERGDLERWIAENPDLLGEPLLVITTEFDRFDKSNLRLDLLALDSDGKLAVVELKLDATGTLVDLQAVRYAAHCSTMTMDDAVEALERHARKSSEEARQSVMEFLGKGELPSLDSRPRIILAAGSFHDPDLTSSVLWLNSVGLDISCVELTPYRTDDGSLVIVPKVIIPVPEARDYMVEVRRKEQVEAVDLKRFEPFARLTAEFTRELANLGVSLPPAGDHPTYRSFSVRPDETRYWYHWTLYRNPKRVSVGVGVDFAQSEDRDAVLSALAEQDKAIARGIDWDHGPGLGTGRPLEFWRAYSGPTPPNDIAPEAARVMKLLIDRTGPIIERALAR